MKAEVISIGDEMTSGQRLDTNSRWLSQHLADLGITTLRHTTVADDLDVNVDVFTSAAARADVVISTGGLGPTLDDLTRDALAVAFQRPLELDQPSLDHITSLFAQRQRPMPERNRIQAMLPRGSVVIPNQHGTAPGIELTVPREGRTPCRIFALPGVPAEMVEMWHRCVQPRLRQMLGSDCRPVMFHTIKLFGIGESDVEVQLPDMMRRDRYPRVGITVSRATISLRIVAHATSQAEFDALIAPTVQEIEAALGLLIFGSGEDELEHAVLRLLRQAQSKLALLEIGPHALAGSWLLSALEPQDIGRVEVVSFDSLTQAQQTLGRLNGGGTPRSLPELASGVAQLFNCDIGLAFGTYAAANQLLEPKPSADVNIAMHGANLPSEVRFRTILGHPDILNDRIAKTALDTLRLALLARGPSA